MKSLEEIAAELKKRLPSACTVEVDTYVGCIDVYKMHNSLWMQADFDAFNKVMNENELMMWMRMDPIANAKGKKKVVPVFHIHRQLHW